MKKTSIFTVSLIAMMAAMPAYAEIASSAYVQSQIQPVETKIDNHVADTTVHVTAEQKTAWNAKEDSSNKVTDKSDYTKYLTGGAQASSGTQVYPSMSVAEAMINDQLDDSLSDYVEKTDDGSLNKLMIRNASGVATNGTGTDISVSGTTVTVNHAMAADSADAVAWSGVTGKPTTLSGYGITDGVQKNNAITGATKTKITYDSKGLVTAGEDLAESDIPALSISKTTGLQSALNAKEVSSNKVTSLSAQSTDTQYPSAKAVYDADKAIKDTIGTVANGKTVVQMISDAQTAASYDDTALAGRVSANETAITKLNGNASTTGSVANSIATALSEYSKTGADTSYATADQGTKADSALQTVTANNGAGVVTNVSKSGTAITMTKAKVTESDLADAVVAKLGAGNSALQATDITTGATNGTIAVDGTDVAVKGLGGAAYKAENYYQTAGNYIVVPASSSATGKSVLTYDAEANSGAGAYYWEPIGR